LQYIQLNVQTIEDLSSGAAFCQLLDILHHGTVRMHKINWNAKLEHENLANLKLLTTAMHALNIDKKFDVLLIVT
jgi:RP/EB family microtubule-associated protein